MFDYGKYCDHTVLKAYTKQEIVKGFCDEAKKYGAASICVNPIHVAFVKKQLEGTGINTCTVIGFPLGANTPETKAFETAQAVENGADELDMVINVGALRDGDTDLVYRDIKGVVDAAKGKVVKVIIETCYLTDEEKRLACELSKKAGAHYVKTSSGFGTRGASVHDLELMIAAVGDTMKIKASSGILCREHADTMIATGAHRLGLSTLAQIAEDNTNFKSTSSRNAAPEG